MPEVTDKFLRKAVSELSKEDLEIIYEETKNPRKNSFGTNSGMTRRERGKIQRAATKFRDLISLFGKTILNEKSDRGFPKFIEFAKKYNFPKNVTIGAVITRYVKEELEKK